VLELIGSIATVIAVAGVILNNYRRREGFLLFLVSNTLALTVHAAVGVWSMVARDAIFFVLAIHGWMKWTRQDAERPADGRGQEAI
jgi:nicotinamide riboside transporter PnuC